MKKDLVLVVLFLYVLALAKPVTPAIQDMLAHTFWKMEHIATVHYENGKYHLHNELKDKTESESNKGTSNSAIKMVKDISVHLKKESSCPVSLINNTLHSFANNSGSTAPAFLSKNNPPPEYTVIS